jgi:hypothetical protein
VLSRVSGSYEDIAKQETKNKKEPKFDLPKIKFGESNLLALREKYQAKMTRVADFDRSTDGMTELFSEICVLCDNFFDVATIADAAEISELYKLYDMALTQRATLSAMLSSAKALGTHGSAFVDRMRAEKANVQITTRTLTRGALSEEVSVSKMPNPELWFETLLAKQRKEMKK